MHQRSLERFDFDSVLLPYSYVLLRDPGYRADVETLLTTCAERRVAVQTIKSVARRRWPDPAERRFSWYEPLTDPGALARAVRFVLACPQLFLNTSSDARLLRPILDAATTTAPAPSDDELARDVDTYGMRSLFDGVDLERI
jgi:hypothetical protein